MKCELLGYMVPEGPPFFANGASRAVTRCLTHDWTFDGRAGSLCPIGRIEAAADAAVERINRAAGGNVNVMLTPEGG